MQLCRRVARCFAETMLFWRGHLRAQDVWEFLGVSERTARSLLSEWREAGLLPRYQPNPARRLLPAEEFVPGPDVIDPRVALSLLLLADRLPGNPFAPFAPPGGGHDLAISALTSSKAARGVLAACLDRRAVTVIYAAKTGRQEFVFSPSALVRSRGRYHLRGHRADGSDALGDRLHDRYVDMVPARSIEAWPAPSGHFVGLENDEEWHAFESLTFSLSSELSEEERLCYEHEYGIADLGKLVVRERRALMPYLLQELAERRCWRQDGTQVPVWAL